MTCVIGFDADDTLWHCENHFASAQEQFTKLLAPYGAEPMPLARLMEVERRNMRVYGYGVKGFTLSMIETAVEISSGHISGHDIGNIIELGRSILDQPLEIIDGVRPVLEHLAVHRRLLLVTKGDLLDQEAKISRSGLADLFSVIEIVSEKDQTAYQRLLHRHGIEAQHFVMVGNSLRSDILPVVALGGRGIHVPYRITAVHEVADDPGTAIRCESIREVPRLLDAMGA